MTVCCWLFRAADEEPGPVRELRTAAELAQEPQLSDQTLEYDTGDKYQVRGRSCAHFRAAVIVSCQQRKLHQSFVRMHPILLCRFETRVTNASLVRRDE